MKNWKKSETIYFKRIYDEVYDKTSNDSLVVDNLNNNKFRYCKFKKLIDDYKLNIIVKRIPLELEDLDFTYNEIVDYKTKNKFDKRTLIKTNDDYNNMDIEIVKINEFCDRIMNRIFINIKQELLKINFNEYTFYYKCSILIKI